MHALALVDLDEALIEARLRDLCASALALAYRPGPEPKHPQRTAEIRRKDLRPMPPEVPRKPGWVAQTVLRVPSRRAKQA